VSGEPVVRTLWRRKGGRKGDLLHDDGMDEGKKKERQEGWQGERAFR